MGASRASRWFNSYRGAGMMEEALLIKDVDVEIVPYRGNYIVPIHRNPPVESYWDPRDISPIEEEVLKVKIIRTHTGYNKIEHGIKIPTYEDRYYAVSTKAYDKIGFILDAEVQWAEAMEKVISDFNKLSFFNKLLFVLRRKKI